MMNNATTEDTILSKITKLLAKAEGTSNPHEAETFTAKAMELMMKWSIDEAMLAAHRGATSEPAKIVQIFVPIRGIYHAAHLALAHQVGKAFGFRTIRVGPDYWGTDRTVKDRIVWIGFENDVATAQLLYTSLLVQLDSALRAFVKSIGPAFKGLSPQDKFVSRRSFIYGFADEVGVRITELRQTAVTSTPGAGLVLANRDHLVDDFTESLYPNLQKGRRSTNRVSGYGYSGGKVAGGQANLATQAVTGARREIGR